MLFLLNFDKDKLQKEINLQMDVTKKFDANRQEAGITVGNIVQALEATGQAIDGAKQAHAIANKIEQENKKLSPEDQLLFGNLIIELSQSQKVEATDSYYPLIVGAGEVLAMAAGACAKSPACVSATVNALRAVGVAILSEQSEDKDKKSTPKPLPSTSGNSATGMPPEPDDGQDESLDNIRAPNSRHNASSVTQRSQTKENNTVVTRSVNMDKDTQLIKSGSARNIGRDSNSGDLLHKLPNGRVYAEKSNGQLYPHSGPGVHALDRGAYNALGVYNKFGRTDTAETILKSMKITPQARSAALKVLKENSK
ncbi:hypothetical protein [Acinetobacter sp. ESBL14]|uniref:hypothetical protein n=1 Tax=Acinetobacter sp. ESBL14 TaxID=3077329 RepID=UPI002FC9901B